MGYNTEFQGRMTLNRPLINNEPNLLDDFWDAFNNGAGDLREYNHFDLELEQGQHIVWSSREKTYGFVDQLNDTIAFLRTLDPTLTATGTFTAWGEEAGDVWRILIYDGYAREDTEHCPMCGCVKKDSA